MNKQVKITKLKTYLMRSGISITSIHRGTYLSRKALENLINKGSASKSVQKLVSLHLNITFEELVELLEFEQ